MAAARLFKAGESVYQLSLAVAVDARDADDLARAHAEAHVVNRVLLIQLRGNVQMLDIQHHVARMRLTLVHHQLDGAADHHAAQFLLGGVLRVDRADAATLAQHRHAVGHGHDLVELVGDEEDALALAGEAAHNLDQFLDLLGREYGGRLVEDQHLVVAIEHLEDLDALLHPHGDVLNLRIQIDGQAVALGQRADLGARLLLLEEAHARVLRAQYDVVQHGKDVDQLEVLVYHADMQRSGVVGIVDFDLAPVLFDRAVLRLIHSEEHAHQRRFARAVFAQQRVDLTAAQLKRHVVVGPDARKFLGDVKHLDHIIRVHASTSPFSLYGRFILKRNAAERGHSFSHINII